MKHKRFTIAILRRDGTARAKGNDHYVVPRSIIPALQQLSCALLRSLEGIQGSRRDIKRLSRVNHWVEEIAALGVLAVSWGASRPDVEVEVGIHQHGVLREPEDVWRDDVSRFRQVYLARAD